MPHPTAQRALFEEPFAKPVVVQFDGEQSSSDGGALLLGAVDRRIGLTKALGQELEDGRRAWRVEHGKLELFRQRVFSIALGLLGLVLAFRLRSHQQRRMARA